MEYHECIQAIKESDQMVIGVLVPLYFQWSLLSVFRRDLQSLIVIPIDSDIAPCHIYEIVKMHQKYFPQRRIVLLWDKKPEYHVNQELVLYLERCE